MYINIVGEGAFTNDVSIFLELFDPPSPLCQRLSDFEHPP